MKNRYKKILSRGDTVGGKQVQNDKARDCRATARNDGESGRSMVEMLGVLAVIGVLSVAGIAGYTTAMNQYRANEAINSAMRAAVMLSAQRLANPNATLNTSGLDSGFSVGSDTDKIVLTLSNVDEKVRSRIEAMGFKNATVTPGENGALTFTFNNDLSERSGNSSNSSDIPIIKTCLDDPTICNAWEECVNKECKCNATLCLQNYCVGYERAECLPSADGNYERYSSLGSDGKYCVCMHYSSELSG